MWLTTDDLIATPQKVVKSVNSLKLFILYKRPIILLKGLLVIIIFNGLLPKNKKFPRSKVLQPFQRSCWYSNYSGLIWLITSCSPVIMKPECFLCNLHSMSLANDHSRSARSFLCGGQVTVSNSLAISRYSNTEETKDFYSFEFFLSFDTVVHSYPFSCWPFSSPGVYGKHMSISHQSSSQFLLIH